MAKKKSFEEIVQIMKGVNSNIELLGEYEKETGKTKKCIRRFIKCKCLIDGYEWSVKWSKLQQGSGCPQCAGNKKLTLEQIKLKLKEINPNIEILSDKYINAHTKLKCRCKKDNHIWMVCWNTLQQSYGCPKCANMAKLTIEYCKNELKTINPNIEILSEEYINAKTKLKLHCKIDDNIWFACWDKLSHNQGCPECAIRKCSGESHPNWKGGVSPLHAYLRDKIKPWKKDSFKKYNYKCDITGSTKNKIIHHLYGFDKIFQETMEILNLPIYQEINKYTSDELKVIEDKCLELHYKYGLGVCLCEEEHKQFHSIYGYGGNTPEQYCEFREMRLEQLNNL